jgi:hypothetical protein
MDINNNNDFSDITHIISYIVENHHKFLLLLFVFVIIYFVDYITHINAMLYGVTAVPGLPNLKTHMPHFVKNPKEKRDKRRNSHKLRIR